jgi:protease-4
MASKHHIVALAPLRALAVACDGRPKSSSSSSSSKSESRDHSGPALAILDLSSGAPEQSQPGFLGVPSHKPTFDALVRTVEKLGKDKDVKGVFVKLGSASLGIARATELADALEALGKTKPVTCHSDGYTNATMYMATRACSKIWLSPPGQVDSVGIAAQLVYMHKLLAENIGLTIDILQVGKFKGAEEPLTRDGPSDEARASLEGTLGGIRDSWIAGFKKGRPSLDDAAPEDGPYTPAAAKARGLVDEVGYVDEARDAAKKGCGATHDEVRFGVGAGAGKGDGLADIVRVIAGEGLGSAPIALVRATGEITSTSGGGIFGGSGGIVEKELSKTLARLEKDDEVKAVVLRIDSPGGSALASDLLWHGLMKIRAKKPVVVSVGDMAASGGYYLASTGNVIFADETSIVGSIGVVGGKIGVAKALEKIGVHAEVVAAKKGDPKAASRAAYLSPLSAWDDATRAKVLDSMKGIYDLFLDRVVEGRAGKLTRQKLEESAEGRIFGGREGQARGLVDEIGGLSAAIARARDLAKLDPAARVAVVGHKPTIFDSLDPADGDDDASEERAKIAAPKAIDLVSELAPDLVPFVASLSPLATGERALVAVPYAIVVR